MKFTFFEQIKRYCNAIINSTNQKLSDIAALTIGALQEIENKKADKEKYISIIIPASNWQSDNHDYPKYYDIVLEGITENDRADMMILPKSMKTAVDCGFFAVSETFAGKVRVRAMKQPIAEIAAEIILKG